MQKKKKKRPFNVKVQTKIPFHIFGVSIHFNAWHLGKHPSIQVKSRFLKNMFDYSKKIFKLGYLPPASFHPTGSDRTRVAVCMLLIKGSEGFTVQRSSAAGCQLESAGAVIPVCEGSGGGQRGPTGVRSPLCQPGPSLSRLLSQLIRRLDGWIPRGAAD